MEKTREEKLKIFKESQEKTKKMFEQEQKRKEGGFSRVYEDVTYVGLEENKYQLVRILDGDYTPYDESRLSTSPKLVQRSRIVGDDGKTFFCNWSDDQNWFLWKVYKKVMDYKWDKTKGEKGEAVYLNKEKFPDLFKRVALNGKENANVYETGWKPSKSVIINVIDRLDIEWHKANKHSKLIAKKVNVVDGVTYAEPGIPPSVYNSKIFDGVMEKYGFPGDYDIGIIKKISRMGKKPETVYEVQHSKFLIDEESIKSFISSDFLTEEELSWQKYDLDKIFRITSYQKIMNKLKIFIQQVDAKMKTSFLKELETLVEKEKKEFETVYSNNNENEKIESKEEPKRERKTEVIEIKDDDGDFIQNIIKIAPYYSQLSDEEKSLIIGIKDNQIVFKEGENIAECYVDNCNKKQPIAITRCIFCGEIFE